MPGGAVATLGMSAMTLLILGVQQLSNQTATVSVVFSSDAEPKKKLNTQENTTFYKCSSIKCEIISPNG